MRGETILPRHGRRVPPAGFTLIEVLVVVAIIALLVAILLPSLARAREQSRTALCASQLKEFGRALTMYNADARDMLPGPIHGAVELETFGKTASSDYEEWHLPAFLRKYYGEKRKSSGAGTDRIASCPTAQQVSRRILEKDYATGSAQRAFTYALNNWNKDAAPSAQAGSWYGTDPPWYFGYPDYFWGNTPPPFSENLNQSDLVREAKPKRISVIKQASREWAIGDAFNYVADLPPVPVSKRKPGQWRVGTYQNRSWARAVGIPTAPYHSDGLNLLMFDSHVEWQRSWRGTANTE
jgi:prepilin-type N-terminal cleavage/methylation domain-containing protein/prepilin-type processing-associated H-X9-DG protein